jgi:hypothetical protein
MRGSTAASLQTLTQQPSGPPEQYLDRSDRESQVPCDLLVGLTLQVAMDHEGAVLFV